MYSKITLITIGCLFFSSCFLAKDKQLEIGFTADSSAIVLSGLEEVNRYQAEQLLAADSLGAVLVSVSRLAEDTAGQESLVNGKLTFNQANLFFVPDTPFVKGRTYLVKTILGSSFGKTRDILKSDLGKTVKQQQKRLQR